MNYLFAEDILVIHKRIVDKTGGSHGVRDAGLLMSLTERPKASFGGKELYGGVFEKAAVYLESLARYHVFVDGNKRTGIAVAVRFLFLNGYNFTATNERVEKFVLDVVTKKFDLVKIANWFKKHSRKIR